MAKKIAIITGTRAEWGLFYPLACLLRDHPDFELQILATCMHLSADHGMTVNEIEREGFAVTARVPMLQDGDDELSIARAMGIGLTGMAEALAGMQPDAVMVLGDRFEILAAASAAAIMRIPVIHLEGGHETEGAVDNSVRHAVTKLSALHFTAAQAYCDRIVQMGENPAHVYHVGSTGLDNILNETPLTRAALEKDLDFSFGAPSLMVTFHPVTLSDTQDAVDPASEVRPMLAALDGLDDAHLLITGANADAGGGAIGGALQDFANRKPSHRKMVNSLGRLRYLSALRQVDAVIGNSSSGLIEVPSFGIGTINIGDRQKGRLRPQTVIDCANETGAIKAAIARALSDEFRAKAKTAENIFGDGTAAKQIMAVLEQADFNALLRKPFFSLR